MTPTKRASTARAATKPRPPRPTPPPPYAGPVVRLLVVGIPRSGKNSQRQVLNRRTGGRFTIKSKAAASWLESAIVQLVAQRKGAAIAGACLIEVDIYHALPLTSWDQDNVLNLVYDALKHAHILADDKAAIARQGAQMAYVDKGNPRVEITVRPCTRALTLEAA